MKTARSLREYLARTRTTQASLARQVGVTRGCINRIAKGERTPNLRLALRIQAVTGMPVENLLAR